MKAVDKLQAAGRFLYDSGSLSGMLLRALLPVCVMLMVFLLVNLFVFVPLIEHQSLEQKKELCLRLTEIVVSDLAHMKQYVSDGQISDERARMVMLEKIRATRFGRDGKDYFWVIAPDGRLLVHPYRPDLEGVDPGKTIAPDGQLLAVVIQDMIRISVRHGGGFVDYRWNRRDDPATLSNKISYVHLFEPWGWIVGTGVYLDEVERDVAGWRRQLVSLGLLLAVIAAGVSLFSGYRMIIARRDEQKTNRSLMEKSRQLEASENMFRGIFNTGPDGILICDIPEGRILEANPAAQKLLQCGSESCRGSSIFELISFSDAENVRRRVLQAGTDQKNVRNLSATIIRADGSKGELLLAAAAITRNAESSLLVMLTDVTDMRQMEFELTRTRKLDILGQLAGGVAHDFNNMLAGIIGSADMLQLLLDDEPEKKIMCTLSVLQLKVRLRLPENCLPLPEAGRVCSCSLMCMSSLTLLWIYFCAAVTDPSGLNVFLMRMIP
jgi:PAS domain S-box-containing protein